jgi:hypothetical protein
MNQELPKPKPDESWQNYGDANPKIHGGRFVKWTGDMWHIVETRDLQEVGPSDMIQDGERWMIQEYWVEKQDLFIDGDYTKGPTKAFEKVLESLSIEYKTALVDYSIEYFVVDIPFHVGIHGDDSYTANYWEYLEDMGIPVDRFK